MLSFLLGECFGFGSEGAGGHDAEAVQAGEEASRERVQSTYLFLGAITFLQTAANWLGNFECVCPIFTPKLANLINVPSFVKKIEACGRRVPHNFNYGSKYCIPSN